MGPVNIFSTSYLLLRFLPFSAKGGVVFKEMHELFTDLSTAITANLQTCVEICG